MSGVVEAVGIALAVFPLVISCLEHYQEGYDSLRDWVFFRREFTHLYNDLNREHIIFRQLMEGMLRPITESEFELKEMMENPKSDQWNSTDLASKLEQKLCGRDELKAFQSSLSSISENLSSMIKRLEACKPPVRKPLPLSTENSELSTNAGAGGRSRKHNPEGPSI